MKKKVTKVLYLPASGNTAILLILSIAFLLGCFAGCVLTNQLGEQGVETLCSYLDGFLSTFHAEQLVFPEFYVTLFEILRWPLIVVVFGTTPLGLVGIPIIFLLRGFLLSFSIASVFRVMGLSGLWVSLILFGITAVIYVPVLFNFGVQFFQVSGYSVSRFNGESKKCTSISRTLIIRSVIGIILFVLCAFIECFITPRLMGLIAKLLVY